MIKLDDILASCELLWPSDGAEDWDAPGLITGNRAQSIHRVLLSVDVTLDLIDEAIGRYDLIIAHHPFLLKGIKTIEQYSAKGALLAKAIRGDLAIHAAHTNADIVEDGVSDVLAKAMGLTGCRPLVQLAPGLGHGRVGNLVSSITLGELASKIASIIPATASGVRVAGAFDMPVQKIAVCGGAGDSFIADAIATNVDAYVTSDLRHHPVQDAREHARINEGKPAIIDISHWAAEWLWLETAASQLGALHPDVAFEVSDLRTDPFDFAINK